MVAFGAFQLCVRDEGIGKLRRMKDSVAIEEMYKNVKIEVTASSRRKDLEDKKKQRRTLDNNKKLNRQVQFLYVQAS
jgi:hypothetical protein